MRIAVAGFIHESNTFNPQGVDRNAFLAQSLVFGQALLDEWQQAHHEVGGMIEGVRQAGAELLPLVMGWATPGGPVADAVFEEITSHIISEVKRLQPDGLLLSLHGAMVTASHRDGDGEVLARLRAGLGSTLPIMITLDLHGNISERLVDLSTAAIAYRTNPHVDQKARGLEAANLMVRTLRGEIRPVQALAKPPALVNIMVQDTSEPPLKVLIDACRQTEKRPGILAASLLPGFAYADVPHMGPAFIVVADHDLALARTEADRLGRLLWDMRAQLNKTLALPAEAVAQALAEKNTPVVLVETGDNVGGGSAGDSTILLAELLRQGATDAVVCLYAPHEVKLCEEIGIGQEVTLQVGGQVDHLHGDPVKVTGRVRLLHDGVYVEDQPRHGGRRTNNMGRTAVLELPGRNWIVLNSLRHPPFSLGQITCLGIEPARQRILVVKAAIAYKSAYQPIAGTFIEVDTPGLTAVNPRRFQYQHIRDMYPLAEVDY